MPPWVISRTQILHANSANKTFSRSLKINAKPWFCCSTRITSANRGRYSDGLLQYSALNKFTGFNVTSLCACRSDGLGFQRDKPAQWFSPFDNYKKQRIVLFRIFTSAAYKWGARGKCILPDKLLFILHLFNTKERRTIWEV